MVTLASLVLHTLALLALLVSLAAIIHPMPRIGFPTRRSAALSSIFLIVIVGLSAPDTPIAQSDALRREARREEAPSEPEPPPERPAEEVVAPPYLGLEVSRDTVINRLAMLNQAIEYEESPLLTGEKRLLGKTSASPPTGAVPLWWTGKH